MLVGYMSVVLDPNLSNWCWRRLLLKKGVCSFYFLMTSNFPYNNNYTFLMIRKLLYNDECLSFAEMATRQSKDKYARLRSIKSESLSSLALDAKRRKFGEGKFEGPIPLALFQASISLTPTSEVVVVLPSLAVALLVTLSKGKGKVGKSVWEDLANVVGQAHNVITDKELRGFSVAPSHELISRHIHKLA